MSRLLSEREADEAYCFQMSILFIMNIKNNTKFLLLTTVAKLCPLVSQNEEIFKWGTRFCWESNDWDNHLEWAFKGMPERGVLKPSWIRSVPFQKPGVKVIDNPSFKHLAKLALVLRANNHRQICSLVSSFIFPTISSVCKPHNTLVYILAHCQENLMTEETRCLRFHTTC